MTPVGVMWWTHTHGPLSGISVAGREGKQLQLLRTEAVALTWQRRLAAVAGPTPCGGPTTHHSSQNVTRAQTVLQTSAEAAPASPASAILRRL